jgi:translation elongation factor EF-Ts
MNTTVEMIKQLRSETGKNLECRKALEQGTRTWKRSLICEKAAVKLRNGRTVKAAGHNRLIRMAMDAGVMVEINTETKFASRSGLSRFARKLRSRSLRLPRFMLRRDIPNKS